MRALVRPLAYQSAFSPIETIVFVCVLATLAYFHILAAVKHSSFFAPSFPATLRPAHARLATGSWVGVSERDWFQAFKHPEDGDRTIELQQIVFSLDDKTRKVSIFNQFLGHRPSVIFTSTFPEPLFCFSLPLLRRAWFGVAGICPGCLAHMANTRGVRLP